MYSTSKEFKEAIYTPIRQNKARVTFDITDVTVNEDNKTIITSEEFILSNKDQINNNKRTITNSFITCEKDKVKLDGSFIFADDSLENLGEVGWCSNILCDENGVFEAEQLITYVFEETHSLIGLTVTFDNLNNEYATEFEIRSYGKNNNLINSILVIDNIQVQREVVIQLLNFIKIEIVIKKWNKGYRRAKVLEIDWGIIRVYEDDKLIKFNYIEEVDLLSSQVPSSEFKFTIDNSYKLFNILNPKGLYKFLQEKQNVFVEVGTVLENGKVEYVPVGKFLLKTWQSDEGDLTATFTNNTRLDLLENYSFENLVVKSNYSLYDLIEELFKIASIENYEIDNNLKTVYTKCLVEKASCKEVVQLALIASCSNIFINRNSKIIIKRDLKTLIDTDISLDNMYSVPSVELEESIKTVEVTYFNNLEDKVTVVLVDSSLKLGGAIKVENNTLIDNEVRATEVANWLMNRSKLRNKYTLNWRGNTSLELTDHVTIDNSYREDINAYITKIELEYSGYLKGKTELVGGVK